MVAQLIEALRAYRGRYPIANMAGDYLELHGQSAFRLGAWLAQLDIEELDDIQLKLEQFLHGQGPEHAGEDLVSCVRLLSLAEAGGRSEELDSTQMWKHLNGWHEANLFEKLRRRALLELAEPLSIDPSVRRATQFHATVAPALVKRFVAL